MDFINGDERKQMILLPDCVDDYIGSDNTVRVIDAYIENIDLKAMDFQKSKPNETGRPMYNPKDLLKLYVYGYMNRVRSSRRLEAETKRNLEVIWLLKKLSPDHKTIARFRHDNSVALKNVFKDFVKLCVELGLYGKELVAIDGSKFPAVNSKDRNFTASQSETPKKKLNDRIARIDSKIEEYMKQIDETDDKDEASEKRCTVSEIKSIVENLNERKERYKAHIKTLEKTNTNQISETDKDSRLMSANGKMDVCYNVQTAVDEKNKLIAEFDVTNHPNDKNCLTPMAKKTAKILETSVSLREAVKFTAVADKGYNAATDIANCLMNDIKPEVAGSDMDICLPTKEHTGEIISEHCNGRTVYVKERNIAICPMGNILYPKYFKKSSNRAIFYNTSACKNCNCRCTKEKNKKYRFEIAMPESEFTKEYNDKDLYIKQIHIKPDKEIIKKRKAIVEHPFGTIKRHHYGDYCLTKGLDSVTGEFSLTFLAYNFRRAINIIGTGRLIELIKHIRFNKHLCYA